MLNEDIISMPDKWEYPWYAAWDLAFHTLPLAIVDPDFAKAQMQLLLKGAYLHPSGQMPAYEWNFSDVNPPVHAFATLFLHRTEQALRDSEARYRDLFDNAGELIQGVAPDGKFVYVNRAWCEALGYAESEVVSTSAALSMFDIIHPEDRPHYTALFNRLMAGEQAGSLAARSRFVAKDGRIIAVEGQLSATIGKEGHAITARGIFRDITDRQQIEAERERLLAAEARRAVQLQTGGE